MFTPEIAKKASTMLLHRETEAAIVSLFQDVLDQAHAKVRANSTDAELRAYANTKELLDKFINYRQHLEDAVKHGIASTRHK